jgi:hypothetical protein
MSERKEPNRSHRPSSMGRLTRRRLGFAGGSLGFAAVAALLVVVAPLSSAHGTVTFTAPYTGFTTSPSEYVNHTGCGSANNPAPLSWNASVGEVQFASATAAGACTRGGDGYGEAFVSLASPLFSAPTSGLGSIYVTYSSAFSARAALTLGSASTNTTFSGGFAEVGLVVEVYVWDATHHNDSLVASAYQYIVDQYFYSASGTFVLTQGWTTGYLYASATYTAGHVYQATVYVDAYVSAETYGGGSTATASLNMGGSDGLVISYITAS